MQVNIAKQILNNLCAEDSSQATQATVVPATTDIIFSVYVYSQRVRFYEVLCVKTNQTLGQ